MTRDNLRDAYIAGGTAVVMSLIIIGYFLVSGGKGDANGTSDVAAPAASPSAQQEASAAENNSRIDIMSATDPAVADLIKKVFRHMYLPSGKVEVRTVQKPDELRKENPVFYQFASQGDHVLFYEDRAILYNPGADKVIDVMRLPQQ